MRPALTALDDKSWGLPSQLWLTLFNPYPDIKSDPNPYITLQTKPNTTLVLQVGVGFVVGVPPVENPLNARQMTSLWVANEQSLIAYLTIVR